MKSPTILRMAGRAAISSAAAGLLLVATAIVSSALKLGNTNTFSVVLMILMALMIVVALALYPILRSQAPAISLAATAIGILAMLLEIVVHALLLASVLSQDQFSLTGEGIGPGGMGLWVVLANYVALQSKALPRGLAWTGLITGAGWLMTGVGALIGGPQNLLSSIGPLGMFFVYPVWAIWLGRWLRRQVSPIHLK